MKRFQNKYRIDTTRLQSYDYASDGWYFVTICTKDRVFFFGQVRDGIMGLSRIGCVALARWAAIADHFDRAVMDACIVMPNHVHGIIGLMSPDGKPGAAKRDSVVETCHGTSLRQRRGDKTSSSRNKSMGDISPAPGSLGIIVNQSEGAVTRWARRNGYDTFAWQPRFYDRVIRNDRELKATRRYILDNPLNWHLDKNHPANLG